MYLQNISGKFSKSSKTFSLDTNYEDVGTVFFDADNDGDQDLYVISGGSENRSNNDYYTDRLHENKDQGNLIKNTKILPKISSSGLRVSPADYDNDGDIDLFIGGRVKPGFYGRQTRSYLLENTSSNGSISFNDVTKTIIPEMLEYTMITASVWIDMDKDGNSDFNKDAAKNILLLGNLYGSEVETPWNDASYGTLLVGNSLNDYKFLNNSKTNLWANSDIKDAAFITIGNTKAILLARNNDKLSIIKIRWYGKNSPKYLAIRKKITNFFNKQ